MKVLILHKYIGLDSLKNICSFKFEKIFHLILAQSATYTGEILTNAAPLLENKGEHWQSVVHAIGNTSRW